MSRPRDSKRNPIDPAPSSLLPFDESAPGAVRPSKTAVIVLTLGIAMTFVFGGLALWSYLTN
ncbi:MAG: hypothetical protein FJW50_02310 [Actinobacteria bacterium]|nr:hypothetical protein [Actinomycetota bacterium]